MKDNMVPVFKTPSQVTSSESAILNNRDLVNDWQKRVDEKQIKEGMKILRIFGLENIYFDSPLPNTEEAYKFLRRNKI